MASVSLQNVTKYYKSKGKQEEVVAVQNFTLCIKDRECIALLGPSGCGKTSTLRMIAGLEEISRGIIQIGNRIVNNLPPGDRDIAMAFETYALYPHLTVRDNISFCLRTRKVAYEEISKRIEEIASFLDITDILDRSPAQLSGGQQQRVSLARALIRRPSVFLLDEPLSHVDARFRQGMCAELKHLIKKSGVTTIFVTHDQEEALAIADRIAVMNFAKLQQVGTREDLIYKPVNMFVAGFIGEPSINFFPGNVIRMNGDYHFVSEDGTIRIQVSDEIGIRILRSVSSQSVILGIRPQFVRCGVSTSPTDSCIVARVIRYESLGEKGHLTMQVGNHTLVSITKPGLAYGFGETVMVTFDSERLLFFDPSTQIAL